MNNPSKARVLHIITRLIRGGADENTILTVEGLDPDFYSIDLVVGGQSDPGQCAQVKKARVIEIKSLVREINPLKDAVALWKLVLLIKRNRYDIVHTHTAKAGMLGRFAAWLCKTPIVIHTLHGSTFHSNLHPFANRIYKTLERLTARITDVIISVGEDLTSRYHEAGVGTPEQYVLIRSGFNLSRFELSEEEIREKRAGMRRELGISESDLVVATIGRLEPRKGHQYLLDAAQDILRSRNSLKFILAGEGSASHKLKNYCRKNGIEKNIIFTGYREDVEDVISASDIIALTSLWEGLPRVIVQSASLGKPLVTFNTEGAAELIRDGENGFIVPLKDVRKFSERLLYLLNHPETAGAMGKKGRGLVTNDWDAGTMVEAIDRLYKEQLDKHVK